MFDQPSWNAAIPVFVQDKDQKILPDATVPMNAHTAGITGKRDPERG
jgi:hypothetical protein